ncbi:hypothetical protein M413DRAFT_444525 [Hebeloma cylindrosporum]|uniref:Uncharacterized protein n=1 Tax=Hebeloma cylindrosporum TaxID=76867 RepID=A0A0C3C1V0_HEBCY|nr:hypothetical protein M413DRAFT_444525 [Hebeloma cylindrosporum h7]
MFWHRTEAAYTSYSGFEFTDPNAQRALEHQYQIVDDPRIYHAFSLSSTPPTVLDQSLPPAISFLIHTIPTAYPPSCKPNVARTLHPLLPILAGEFLNVPLITE